MIFVFCIVLYLALHLIVAHKLAPAFIRRQAARYPSQEGIADRADAGFGLFQAMLWPLTWPALVLIKDGRPYLVRLRDAANAPVLEKRRIAKSAAEMESRLEQERLAAEEELRG